MYIIYAKIDVTGGDDMGLDYSGPWRTALDDEGSCWTEGPSCVRVMVQYNTSTIHLYFSCKLFYYSIVTYVYIYLFIFRQLVMVVIGI